MGDRLATINMGRKVGEAAVPLSVGGAKSPSNTISLVSRLCLHTKWHIESSNCLATMHQRYRQRDRQRGQRSHSIGRTVTYNGRLKITCRFTSFQWLLAALVREIYSPSTTRHRASTSMYSLTFCVRVMSPERHHWKPAVQAAAVMLKTPPSTASHRPASHAHLRYTARNFENAPVTRRSLISNARTPRVN